MVLKLIGSGFVLLGCTGFGFLFAGSVKRECRTLRQLIAALEFIICEINYRMTPLPELFRLTSSICSGVLGRLFLSIANELDKHTSSNADICVQTALKKHPDLPKSVGKCITLLGQTIGSFNIAGQIKLLEAVKAEASRLLKIANDNQENKLRCYKMLGLSAGAALVIIFI